MMTKKYKSMESDPIDFKTVQAGINRGLSPIVIVKILALFLLLLVQGISPVIAGDVVTQPSENYQYPDVWVRDGASVVGVVMSWTKHGNPVLFNPKDVLLNRCGSPSMCGQFFFSGKKINGKWEYAKERGVVKITLNDGGIMHVKSLGSFSEEYASKLFTSDTYSKFKDGRRIRHRGRPSPSSLDFNSTSSCNFWNKGDSGYFEMLSPAGERIWAKYILVKKMILKYLRVIRTISLYIQLIT